MMADALRAELNGKNIRVITVNPGPTDTRFFDTAGIEINPEKFLKPGDVAQIIGDILNLNRRASITEIDVRPTEA
jgi:short-subunit dehydrogenase